MGVNVQSKTCIRVERVFSIPAGVLFLIALIGPVQIAQGQSHSTVDFNRDVRPILSNHCFACHGPDESSREAGLRLDIKTSAMAELESGEGFAIVPGSLSESILWQRINATEGYMLMPPAHFAKPLSDGQKETLQKWIKQGAQWQKHWAYRSLKRPPVPVEQTDQIANPIDAFLRAKIKEANERLGQTTDGQSTDGQSTDSHSTDSGGNLELGFSDIASHELLVRRLHLDITGMPPGAIVDIPDDISGNESNYRDLVDRLLDHPAYGERMASYWFDLVRYADTVGYHGDQEHHITPYRDWVIAAFNDNMPFDQFTIEQLAGDLLPNPASSQLIATGYNRMLQTTHEGGAQDKEYLAKYFADRVRNVSEVWFGATVACAQCHDHKYDPIPQADFYRLGAFFADIQEMGAYNSPNTTPTTRPPEIRVLSPLLSKRLDTIELDRLFIIDQIDDLKSSDAWQSLRRRMLTSHLRDLTARANDLRAQAEWTMITVSTSPRRTRVLHRGDWMDESGEIVDPAILSALPQIKADRRLNRLDLAQWIVGQSNPLTARVMANRLWYLCFGEGLYRTMEDTGAQGDPPTHPELLDWLAVELIESGWDIKHVLRLILTSDAYRQMSKSDRSKLLDPNNSYFSRQNRFRISAEMIRDQALSVSGLLNGSMGGRASKPYQPAGYYSHLNFPKRKYVSDRDLNQYRRGVYVHWQRQFLHPMLKAFDAPSREECTAKRHESNTPLAALVLLNDPTFVEAARAFAVQAIDNNASEEQRIQWMWNRLLFRDADSNEVELMLALVREQRDYYAKYPQQAKSLIATGLSPIRDDIDTAEQAAWTFAARALLNLNESITRN
jgi:hypothetical protein